MSSHVPFLAPSLPRPAFLAAALALAAALPAAALTPPPPMVRPLGPELRLNGPAPARRDAPAVGAFADGGFAVAWIDGETQTVRLRLIDRHDRALPVLVVGQDRLQRAPLAGPDIAVLGDQTLLVVWADGTCPPGPGEFHECTSRVLGRRYSRAGAALTEAFAVGEEEGAYWAPKVAALIDAAAPRSEQRGFVVAWTVDHDSSGCTPEEIFELGCNFSDVRGRVWSSDFTPLGPSLDLVRRGDEDFLAGVAGTADGGFVAVWTSWTGEGSFFDAFRRRFDAAGTALEDDVLVSDEETRWGRQVASDVAALSDGGHVVAWVDSAYPSLRGDHSGYAAVVRAYRADGEPVGPEILASRNHRFHQDAPDVAGGADGGFLVTWTDSCAELCGPEHDGADGSGSGVFASYFSPVYVFGEILFDQALAVETDGHQHSTSVASDGAGGWVAAWVQELGQQASSIRARRLGFASPCEGLCLDGRFSVTVSWKDFQGNRGVGQPVVRGDDWGTFWFFHPDNVELAIKVLDARTVDGHFWVFAGALSNVEYRLRVTDTATGLAVDWVNPAGTFLSRADTRSLAAPHEEVIVPPQAAATAPASARLPAAPASATPSLAAPLTLAPCPAGTVCLQGDRFQVSATWRDFAGNRGTGTVLPLTADTAWVWFFHPGNPELVVKVLDGRPMNGHFWVFYGALSNVEFELTVTDRLTGEQAVYTNPSGTFASRGDTTAFAGD